MSVKTLGPYDFPARDRQEIFGEDQLVNVLWRNNMLFATAVCFRVPKTMLWSDFKSQMIDPWASTDPDYAPISAGDWLRDDEPIDPAPEKTLADLGIPHKGLITFRTA